MLSTLFWQLFWRTPFAAAAATLDGKALRPFCQIDSLPVLYPTDAVNLKSLSRLAVTEPLFVHGFHDQFLEFRCVPLVRYPFWHNKSPHMLDIISYCLTYGVQFTLIGGLRYYSCI